MKLKLPMPEGEYKRVAKGQKECLKSAANKIEKGEELSTAEMLMACAVLRGVARDMPTKQKKKPGNPNNPGKLPPGFSLEFVMGDKFENKSEAVEFYATKYQVSVEAIRKRLKRDSVAESEYPIK